MNSVFLNVFPISCILVQMAFFNAPVRNRLILVIALFPMLLFQNCSAVNNSGQEDVSSNALSVNANFQWINENIVQPTCIECHSSSLAFAGLNYTTYEGVMESVVPGEPMESDFYKRSFTTQFFQLSSDEREIIRLWILTGANP